MRRIRLTPLGRRNLAVFPIVILVRLPLALPLIAMQWIVEFAEAHFDVIPGIRLGAWWERY